jgi:hypothetical protein
MQQSEAIIKAYSLKQADAAIHYGVSLLRINDLLG